MAKSKKHQKNSQQKNYSTIPEHKRQGKKLIPPLVQNFDWTPSSWKDDRLPEILWAILLVTHLSRENALNVFRKVAKYIEDLPRNKKFDDVTHTVLSKLPPELLNDVLAIITERQEQKEVLSYLLLLDKLPGRKAWERVLGIDRISDDWSPLMESVGRTLWHQTQESTDCRWLTVLCRMMAGKIEIAFENPEKSRQRANEDMWQEFQTIDLGHWAGTNLRKMSEEAGMKDVYDRFSDWTTTFSHGHWSAIRDAVFDTCGNPLHRFHRIPSQSPRALPDVVPDACQLVDKILEIVSQLYPHFQDRVTLIKRGNLQ